MSQMICGADNINLWRLIVMRSALTLEIAGMKRRGRSAYSLAKSEFGWRGNRTVILAKLTEEIAKSKDLHAAQDK